MSFKNTLLPVATSLKANGRILSLEKPVVMGILNATPDSFFSNCADYKNAVDALLPIAAQMLEDGATILDIGGASTRPGAAKIDAQEEAERILPLIEALNKIFPHAWLSVDTYYASVAKASLLAGASIINDISAGDIDAAMHQVVQQFEAPYIAMHMQGNPQTMQNAPLYRDVVQEVFDYLREKVLKLASMGIYDVILDPGFGFGKTIEHNYTLLSNMHVLRTLGKPILAGVSRKSMIYKPLNTSPQEALNGTTALHMVALQQGASILRVHDVRAAWEAIQLFELLD